MQTQPSPLWTIPLVILGILCGSTYISHKKQQKRLAETLDRASFMRIEDSLGNVHLINWQTITNQTFTSTNTTIVLRDGTTYALSMQPK